MSGTPRTDTVLASYFNPGPSRLCDLARELERELNSANAAIRQQQLLEEENLRLKDRIKRLEMAGNEMAGYLGDGYYVVQIWIKAVETKP